MKNSTSYIIDLNEKEILKCPLFQDVQESDVAAMLLCLNAVFCTYEKNEVMIQEGDPADRIGILIRGEASVLQDDIHGNRVLFRKIGKNGMFGESFACSEEKAYPLSIQADTPCSVIYLKTDQIFDRKNFCQFQGILIRNLLHIVAKENVKINRRLSNTMHKTTREKRLAYLCDEKRRNDSNSFMISYDRQQLADYLGVERSALSAVISGMKKEGLLTCEKNRFTIYTQQEEQQ